ncbi:PQQ-binding-like beta-propeller repeat protein [Halobacteria archaeon AArc-curdl1]|uniref:PQQ-binding-like beta-propeller repeat protein n=1 Tax=Natronosalvus hydrolyticus TaxID=2979988 RepID=A0AAP2ZE20_9EURY|nr:PQQ-binding-like beta-propeller repeat protein [Halobacteria archaeon AArc-curdl1]
MADQRIYVSTSESDLYWYTPDGESTSGPTADYIYTIYQTPTYLYIAGHDGTQKYLRQYEKVDNGNELRWESHSRDGNQLIPLPNEDIIEADPQVGDNVRRFSSEDGSVIWELAPDEDGNITDVTVLSNSNVLVAYDGSSGAIVEYDWEDGSVINTLEVESVIRTISRDDNDNYVIGESFDTIRKRTPDGDIIWEVEPIGSSPEFCARTDEVYVITYNSDNYVSIIDEDGNIVTEYRTDHIIDEYNEDSRSSYAVPLYDEARNLLIAQTADVDDDGDNEICVVDPFDESMLWSDSHWDNGFNSNGEHDVSAAPPYVSFEGEWIETIDLSGTVGLQGTPIEGAEILVIDDESDEFLERVVADENGEWSAEVADTTLHVTAQYEDEDGNQYNAESYPYVTEDE